QSLAILPLRNITGDRQQDYFAEGLTAALGSAIGQIHSIRVVSAASSQHYLDTSGQPKQIATRLGADALLEGTARLSAGRVTVTIDLVDGRTDRRLWTQNYERDLADIMMLFADAARGVAAEMLATLDSVSLSRPRRLEPGAAAAYLKGEYFRKRWMEGGCFPAERYFQE